MNLLNMLQEFTAQIMDDPLLSDGQQEQKMIQVFDLCHFVDSYGYPMKILDYKNKINVVEEGGIRKGIYFCDLLFNTQYSFDDWFYKQENIQPIRNQLMIQELWFVSVVESTESDDLKGSKEFIQRHNVEILYDKQFYFNFSRSTIKILK